MPNNIFLTGEINVGKSTIINTYIEENKKLYQKIAGFKTKEVLEEGNIKGYYIEDQSLKEEDTTMVGINEDFPQGKRCRGIPSAFDTKGVEILRSALKSNSSLVLMDELGFFEKDALLFQDKVFEILDSEKRVLGVIKKRSNPFLDKVKERKDVVLLEVDLQNRKDIIKNINTIWRD